MLKKVENPFVVALKSELSYRFPALPVSTGRNVAGIDVNPVSAWVRGEVSPQVAEVLKDAGFVKCTKGYYFTHNCVKMPKFAPAKPAPAPVKPAEKPAKEWVTLPAQAENQIAQKFVREYPGCLVEIKGTWVYLIGLVFKTNEEYRARAKADGFHYSPKSQAWCRALTPEELASVKVEPVKKPAPAEKAPAKDADAVDELQKLSEIVIRARKGELSRDQMLEAMKAVCPF